MNDHGHDMEEIRKKHRKKMVAPIVVTVLLVLYYIVYFGIIASLVGNGVLRILLIAAPLVPAILITSVCIQRIGEIQSGEEDDLDRF